MIRIKDLEKHYEVSRDNDVYILYALSEMGIYTPSKYVGHVIKGDKKGYFSTPGCEATNDINVLLNDIDNRLKSFKYNCELYHPSYRKGYFEYMAVYEHLNKLGFKSHDINCFKLERKNIYGGIDKNIILSISGIDYMTGESLYSNDDTKNVSITYWLGDYSWIEVKTKSDGTLINNNPDEVIPVIDSLLKPIFLYDSISDYLFADKLQFADLELTVNKMNTDFNLNSTEFKGELIDRLENMLTILKNK